MTTANEIKNSTRSLQQITMPTAKVIIDKEYMTIERYETEGYVDGSGDLMYTKGMTKRYTDSTKFWNAINRYIKQQ